MSSEKLVIYNCLSINITTATFAQPRSYFLTAQCIHKDSDIDDSVNESNPKYRTATSKSTKTPQFNSKKPFLVKLPNDIQLSQALEEYKIVFEAYIIVSVNENKAAKLMGESILVLSDKKPLLLSKEAIVDVITLEGNMKIGETKERVPVGQVSVTMQIQQITENTAAETTENKENSKTTENFESIQNTPKQQEKGSEDENKNKYTVKTANNNNSEQTPAMSPDSRINIEYVPDVNTCKQLINAQLFESIRSQLTDFDTFNDEINKQQLFEAIDRELTLKQSNIDSVNCEFKILGNEIVRLRRESLKIKQLNEKLSNRLQVIIKNDLRNCENINNLSNEKLKSMLIKYVNGHKTEKNKRKHLEKTVLKLIEKLKAAKRSHYKSVEAQERAGNDMDGYKDTIISQEKVIGKLEEMLNWAHETIKALQQKMDCGQIGSNTNRENRECELENEIISLQKENEELRKQIEIQKYATNPQLKLLNEVSANIDIDKLEQV